MSTATVPQVYKAIAEVSAEIAKTGISKDRKNEQQNYKFRGIDDVYNAIAPLLAKHGLVIVPRILSRECAERQTQKGGTLFYVTVEAEFDFIAASDGSKVTARSFGEAMDAADKATNKAMSAAYKYTAFQTFCIPTEGDNDADGTTHEAVKPRTPDGYEDWLIDMDAKADEGLDALRSAYKAAPVALREYLTKSDKAAYERIVKRAEQASAAPSGPRQVELPADRKRA